jgi:hypothetical protein
VAQAVVKKFPPTGRVETHKKSQQIVHDWVQKATKLIYKGMSDSPLEPMALAVAEDLDLGIDQTAGCALG